MLVIFFQMKALPGAIGQKKWIFLNYSQTAVFEEKNNVTNDAIIWVLFVQYVTIFF